MIQKALRYTYALFLTATVVTVPITESEIAAKKAGNCFTKPYTAIYASRQSCRIVAARASASSAIFIGERVASLYQPLASGNHSTYYRKVTFGIGTGTGISPVAWADAEAFGIGTGTGMSAPHCADADAFGIGTGTGMSPAACADAAVIDRTPKINSVEIVFFIVVFLLQ